MLVVLPFGLIYTRPNKVSFSRTDARCTNTLNTLVNGRGRSLPRALHCSLTILRSVVLELPSFPITTITVTRVFMAQALFDGSIHLGGKF